MKLVLGRGGKLYSPMYYTESVISYNIYTSSVYLALLYKLPKLSMC